MFAALRHGSTTATRALWSRSILSRNASKTALYAGTRTFTQSSISPTFIHTHNAAAPTHRGHRHQPDASAVLEARKEPKDASLITEFQQLGDDGLVHDKVVRTITQNMGLSTMTEVQSMTLSEIIKGTDVLAQARTGTGKTLAFLIPTLQNIIDRDPRLVNKEALRTARSTDIRALIISPTRELAEQIAVEAKKLTQNTGVRVQTAVGGSAKRLGLQEIHRKGCHILVGTPGRLIDIFSDRENGIAAPNLSALVLDEADRLLDQGFAEDIQQLQELLPDTRDVDRQTLLFSATVPKGVMSMVSKTLKPDYKFVQTVKEGEEPTHNRVPQKLIPVRGMENMIPSLVELSLREIETAKTNPATQRPFKAMVFFESTSELQLAYKVFQRVQRSAEYKKKFGRTQLLEIHARLSQGQRTRAANDFRHAESAVLFTTNVTARGMDFPNVTHVIQMFLPSQREQYIHRLGRTARANSEGVGYLIAPEFQVEEVPSKLHGLPLQLDNTLATAEIDLANETIDVSDDSLGILDSVSRAYNRFDDEDFIQTHQSMVGALWWNPDRRGLIEALRRLATIGWGMDTPPTVDKKFLDRITGSSRQSKKSFGRSSSGRSHRPGVKFPHSRGRSEMNSHGRDRRQRRF
ncbi:DEAD-domain-containing protein [Xylona heveae TC161]|uniref:ATP-dependent RNA helicase n=1 Tax=Xylona heveae (strain CBS 132557 / TC161) TaxID=1328760 RepID=A0A165INJ6_XYLHT|nr:DEAD-domain-containing protein [Xylona heveae TC161]KZF25154.1 DEAD-domain-containing protein [Xylona heveae TC161]